ncbi:PREDICTED: uncharacterized protein LOC106819791 [Priapulus caudatus]|uniref:Uncharacterized protein LOC106819791 n=1 Tax=Priapulus caudatus TaxID=37621 RepID=A0ABM1F5Z5_PRICU|nr:PREDICTED: uncharacterized protein LOC106819791 [Priapulus caudatus]
MSKLKFVHINVLCYPRERSLKAEITFSGPFTGSVSAKGYHDNSACSLPIQQQSGTHITLRFDSCGIRRKTGIPGKHQKVKYWLEFEILAATSSFASEIGCEYYQFLEDQYAAHTPSPPSHYPLPTVNLWVEPNNNSPATSSLNIALTDNSRFELAVGQCEAWDTASKQGFILTDKNGCSINKDVMTDLVTLKSRALASPRTLMQAYLNNQVFPANREYSVTCNYVLCAGVCDTRSRC